MPDASRRTGAPTRSPFARASASHRPPAEPVTARAFQARVRALPRVPRCTTRRASTSSSPTSSAYGAYRSGRARHLAGVSATDSNADDPPRRGRLPALPARLAMPVLLRRSARHADQRQGHRAHPVGRPLLHRLPRAQCASSCCGAIPYYHGSRPRRLDEIVYRFGLTPDASAALVESGPRRLRQCRGRRSALAASVTPPSMARLARRYGTGSPAARAGHQRYFVNRTLALQYLLLNSRRAAVRHGPDAPGRQLRARPRARSPRTGRARVLRPAHRPIPADRHARLPRRGHLPARRPGRRTRPPPRRHAPPSRRHVHLQPSPPACERAEIVRANLRRHRHRRRDQAVPDPPDVPCASSPRGALSTSAGSAGRPTIADPSDFLDIALAPRLSTSTSTGADARATGARSRRLSQAHRRGSACAPTGSSTSSSPGTPLPSSRSPTSPPTTSSRHASAARSSSPSTAWTSARSAAAARTPGRRRGRPARAPRCRARPSAATSTKPWRS